MLAQLAELRTMESALADNEANLARDSGALQHEQRIFDKYHALQQR